MDRTVADALEQRPPVERPLAHSAEPTAGHLCRVHVGEPRREFVGAQHRHVGARSDLGERFGPETLEVCLVVGEEQVAGAAKVERRRFTFDLDVVVEVLDEVDSELAELDVEFVGELFADAVLRTRRLGRVVGPVRFDHQNPTVEVGVLAEPVGNSAPHHRSTDADDVVALEELVAGPGHVGDVESDAPSM